MKVICVIGVGCTGKSTYCKKLLDDYAKAGKARPLLLQLGPFFRVVFGPDFFKTLDNPAAPAVTEHWVRNNVDKIIEMAYQLNSGKPEMECRDVILDAVPRNVGQLHWLVLSSAIASHSIPLEIKTMYVAEEVLETRMRARRELDPAGAGLTDERAKKDLALHKEVLRAMADARINQKFSFEEVNY